MRSAGMPRDATSSSSSRCAAVRTACSSGRSRPATCIGRRSELMKEPELKPFPRFRSDAEAKEFVESADLSGYDFSGFRPARFEFERKSAQLNMRLPETLLDAVKARALARGIPYTRYIRELIERDVTAPGKP